MHIFMAFHHLPDLTYNKHPHGTHTIKPQGPEPGVGRHGRGPQGTFAFCLPAYFLHTPRSIPPLPSLPCTVGPKRLHPHIHAHTTGRLVDARGGEAGGLRLGAAAPQLAQQGKLVSASAACGLIFVCVSYVRAAPSTPSPRPK